MFEDLMSALSAGAGGIGNFITNGINYTWNKKLANVDYQNAMKQLQAEQEFNAAQAGLAREFSASEASKQRDFEERMSSTAYQRAITDMKAAGINPASIGGGSAASTPQGATANASSASAGAPGAGSHNFRASSNFDNILSSAINGMIAKDRDAAKYLADEFRDNARHAHKMEEIREWKAEKNVWKEDNKNPFDEL